VPVPVSNVCVCMFGECVFACNSDSRLSAVFCERVICLCVEVRSTRVA
jgi:hypothetical protein